MKRAPENDPKVSIVVPIYNVEKYLHKCVDSIIGQTYHNLEIILVDDGSPDNCPAICDEYQKKDSRVRVIHKPNGGLSDARNAGLDIATGEYISFVDSDDWIECDTIEKMLNLAGPDRIVSLQAASVSSNMTDEIDRGTNAVCDISAFEFLKGINEQTYLCSSCGKLYPMSLLKDTRYEVGVLNEDYLFLSTILFNTKVPIVLLDYKGYNYFVREGSISRSGLGKSSIDAVYNTVKMKKRAVIECPPLVPAISAYAAFQARTALLLMSYADYQANRRFAAECSRVIKENNSYLKESFMGRKNVVFCRLCALSPVVAVVIGCINRWIKRFF